MYNIASSLVMFNCKYVTQFLLNDSVRQTLNFFRRLMDKGSNIPGVGFVPLLLWHRTSVPSKENTADMYWHW